MMKYIITDNKIEFYDVSSFNIKQILECGQIFRYQINGDEAVVFSKDKKAHIIQYKDKIEIISSDIQYFENFFIYRQ